MHPRKIKTTSSRQLCLCKAILSLYIHYSGYLCKTTEKWALTYFLSKFTHQSIQNQDDFRCTDLQKWFSSLLYNRLLLKERHLNFSYIAQPYDINISSTSYPITKNEFGHSAAMANRMKDVLPDILGQEQTGFMPGRFIGDYPRSTYDLIQY